MSNKRFNVIINFQVLEEDPAGDNKPFTSTVVEYHAMPPEGMAVVERTMLIALNNLRDYGDKVLAEKKAQAA